MKCIYVVTETHNDTKEVLNVKAFQEKENAENYVKEMEVKSFQAWNHSFTVTECELWD